MRSLSAKLQKGATSCTLEGCLQKFTAVEDLTEKITCEKCKKPQKSGDQGLLINPHTGKKDAKWTAKHRGK